MLITVDPFATGARTLGQTAYLNARSYTLINALRIVSQSNRCHLINGCFSWGCSWVSPDFIG